MTRLKVHHMDEGGVPQEAIAEKCGVGLRSVQRILTEPEPTLDEVASGRQKGARRGRPPKASEEVVERVRELLKEEPRMAATEVLRRSREWGYDGGKTAMSDLVRSLRPRQKVELVVRFEGLPGEYGQFDFGECWVKYADGRCEHVIFFAGRLKYSRFMHVELVANQQSETLVRALIACLSAFGGSPKEWVFDNPRTIRVSRWGVEPIVLQSYLRDLVAEYRVIPTFCAPRSGNQKGSVESLVKFTKRGFLLARKFRDRADLEAQLAEWLHEVDFVRPCDATGVIPDVARQAEVRWLQERPVRVSPEAHPLRETGSVSPMGTVSWKGTPYFVTATLIGAPVTLLIREKTIDFIVADGREHCTHPRQDGAGVVQRHPHQRRDMLGVIHGRRKQATFRRQCLLELGPQAWDFLEILVHRCPEGRWEQPCRELFELLERFGDQAMREAFGRCVVRGAFEVNEVHKALREAA